MKIAGLIGGLGPESTVEYYKLAVQRYRERTSDGSYPHLILDSINLETVIRCMKEGEHRELEDFLFASVSRLANAGADFGTIAANTPHVVFPALRARSPIPLISIVEVTRDGAKKAGMRRPGLFGSRFTMQGRFFPDVFEPADIALVAPQPDEVLFIHEKYVTELILGNFRPETRDALVAIAKRMKREDGIDGLILGGTELPLILGPDTDVGVPMLDPTRLHVDAIVDAILEPSCPRV